MRIRTLLLGLSILMLALPLAASPKQRVLQLDPASLLKEAADVPVAIGVCSYLHELSPDYCQIWHVEAIFPINDATAAKKGIRAVEGSQMILKNAGGQRERYRIDRVVPQYRLDSGAIFEPTRNWNPANATREQWTRVQAKRTGSRVVTDWQDVDGDGLVGARDIVKFDDGETAEIVDVLVGLHVTQVK
jgi:hypothetical protein